MNSTVHQTGHHHVTRVGLIVSAALAVAIIAIIAVVTLLSGTTESGVATFEGVLNAPVAEDVPQVFRQAPASGAASSSTLGVPAAPIAEPVPEIFRR